MQGVEQHKEINFRPRIRQEYGHFVNDESAKRMPAQPISPFFLPLPDLPDVNCGEFLHSWKLLAPSEIRQTKRVNRLVAWQCEREIPVIEGVTAAGARAKKR